MPWVQRGYCPPEHCRGRCCTHLGVEVPMATEADAEKARFLKTRGISIKELTWSDGESLYLADIHQRCQFLTNDGLCALYGMPDRPDFCERWPSEPLHLALQPDCLYEVVWEEDPSKEIAHG